MFIAGQHHFITAESGHHCILRLGMVQGHFDNLAKANIVAKCLKALSGLYSPNLVDQSACRILTTHAKTRSILHDDRSICLGENRPNYNSQTFGGYAAKA